MPSFANQTNERGERATGQKTKGKRGGGPHLQHPSKFPHPCVPCQSISNAALHLRGQWPGMLPLSASPPTLDGPLDLFARLPEGGAEMPV